MDEVQKVLCPVDFSEWSSRALRYASRLCERLNAELTVLHVFETPAYATIPQGRSSVAAASIAETLRLVTQELQHELEAFVRKHGAGRPSTSLLRDGVPEQVITDVVDELGIDLIVMGTQGRSALSRILVGSVTERVVRAGKCPVLTVPAGSPVSTSVGKP